MTAELFHPNHDWYRGGRCFRYRTVRFFRSPHGWFRVNVTPEGWE